MKFIFKKEELCETNNLLHSNVTTALLTDTVSSNNTPTTTTTTTTNNNNGIIDMSSSSSIGSEESTSVSTTPSQSSTPPNELAHSNSISIHNNRHFNNSNHMIFHHYQECLIDCPNYNNHYHYNKATSILQQQENTNASRSLSDIFGRTFINTGSIYKYIYRFYVYISLNNIHNNLLLYFFFI